MFKTYFQGRKHLDRLKIKCISYAQNVQTVTFQTQCQIINCGKCFVNSQVADELCVNKFSPFCYPSFPVIRISLFCICKWVCKKTLTGQYTCFRTGFYGIMDFSISSVLMSIPPQTVSVAHCTTCGIRTK